MQLMKTGFTGAIYQVQMFFFLTYRKIQNKLDNSLFAAEKDYKHRRLRVPELLDLFLCY